MKMKGRTIRVKSQTGKNSKSKKADKQRKALQPGVRISKTGKKYTETRKNRSDRKPKRGY